jgi:hypothetical protein
LVDGETLPVKNSLRKRYETLDKSKQMRIIRSVEAKRTKENAMWKYLVRMMNKDGKEVASRGYDDFNAAVKYAKLCAGDGFSAGVYNANQSCLRYFE